MVNIGFREHIAGASVKRGSLGTDPHMAKVYRRIIAAGAVVAALAGGAAIVLGPMACTATWTVTYPPQLPPGAIVECEATGNVDGMPGFLGDGRGLVVWAWDSKPKEGPFPHTLMRIDPATGAVTWRSETRALQLVAFHSAGPVAIVGGGLKVMDLAGPGDKPIIERVGGYPSFCVFSGDGRFMAVGDHQITLYDLQTCAPVRTLALPAGGQAVHSLVFSPDGKRLAAAMRGLSGAQVAVWNLADGRLLGDLPTFRNAAVVGLSDTGKTIVLRRRAYLAPPGDGAINMACGVVVYNVATGKQLLRTDSPSTICAGATRLLVWPQGKDLHVYDLDTARLERTIPGINQPVLAGNIVAAQQRLKHYNQRHCDYGFWDITTGEKLATVTLPDGSRQCRALSPDGRFLVVGNFPLIVLDRRTGRKILHVTAPARPYLTRLRHVAFSPDSRYLAFSLLRRVGIADLRLLAPGGAPGSFD